MAGNPSTALILVYPWAQTDFDRLGIEREAGSLVGRRIRRVRYLLPSSSDETVRGAYTGFDDTRQGVELSMSEAVVSLTWLMEEFKQGLAIVVAGSQEYAVENDFKSLDVTDQPEWQARMATITGVGLELSSE